MHAEPAPTADQLETLIDSGTRLAATTDLDAASDAVLGRVRRVATTVRLPALVQKTEHLPGLARAMLTEFPAPESLIRLAPAVRGPPAAWHWLGNHAELHATLHRPARRARDGAVELADLPEELRSAGASWDCWNPWSRRQRDRGEREAGQSCNALTRADWHIATDLHRGVETPVRRGDLLSAATTRLLVSTMSDPRHEGRPEWVGASN